MARSKNKPAPIESGDPLKAKITSSGGRGWSLKKLATYALFACGGCFLITLLFPSKPKEDALPTVAAVIPTHTPLAMETRVEATQDETAAAAIVMLTDVLAQQTATSEAQAANPTNAPQSLNIPPTALFQSYIDQTSTAVILQPTMTALDAMVKASQTAKAMPSATLTNIPAPVAQQVVVPTSEFLPFDETAYAVKIMDALSIGAGGRDTGIVRVANGRSNGGEIVAIIPYNTTETNADAQVEEVFDILRSVGVGIDTGKLDVDSVTLIMGVNDQVGLTIVAKASEVVDFAFGRMTKQQLAAALVMTDMTGSSSTTNQQTTVSNDRSETRMIQSQANLRPCPRRTDDCASIVTLQPGTTLTITGDVEGDTVSGSTLWYVGTYNGQTVYVHSSLVAAPGVTSLPSAPVVQPTAGVIVIGSQNQSVVPSSSTGGSVSNSGSCLTCTQYFSCAEAQAALANGCFDLDRDKDGIPCESLCGG